MLITIRWNLNTKLSSDVFVTNTLTSSPLTSAVNVVRGPVWSVVDPKATMFLIGSEMDYSTDKLASRFVFKNPNEKSTCGCGESFSI